MSYCNLDPALLIFKDLDAHDIDLAVKILESLRLHLQNITSHRLVIPITTEYLLHILESLDSIPITSPPISQPLKVMLTNILGRTVSPPLSSTKITDTVIVPDISKKWIKQDTRALWLDCLLAALYEKIAEIGLDQAQRENLIATFDLPVQADLVELRSIALGDVLNCSPIWHLPVITSNVEWEGYFAALAGWPIGLEDAQIELFAYRNLNVPIENIKEHRTITFTQPCHRDIENEADPELRSALIEVIACRAYDQLKPQHEDHKLETRTGIHRVYIKKMNPPARLHYYFDEERVVYCLYENKQHDRGL